jgi:hypothetical protein
MNVIETAKIIAARTSFLLSGAARVAESTGAVQAVDSPAVDGDWNLGAVAACVNAP